MSRIRVSARAAGFGELQKYQVELLRSSESGVVRAVHVQPGDAVVPGQPILQLDTREAEEDLASLFVARQLAVLAERRVLAAEPLETRQSEAAVAQAQAQVSRAHVQYLQRAAELSLAPNVDADTNEDVRVRYALTPERTALQIADAAATGARVSLEMLDLRRFERERHAHEIARLDAAIRSVRARISRMTIRGTVSGIVDLQASVFLTGARVAVGDEIGTVREPNVWLAHVRVVPSVLPLIRRGAAVQVRCPALIDFGWTSIVGHVESVGTASATGVTGRAPNGTTPPVVDVLVKLTLPDSLLTLGDYLRPGIAVVASIDRGNESLFSHLLRTLRGAGT